MLCRAASRLRELNVFVASTSIERLQCHPVGRRLLWHERQIPFRLFVQNTTVAGRHAASCTSAFVVHRMALEIILLSVSQIPMGLIPGHLLSAMRRHARKAERPLGSTCVVQSLLARRASEWQRSCEADLNEVHSLLQQCVSIPEGPFGVESD